MKYPEIEKIRQKGRSYRLWEKRVSLETGIPAHQWDLQTLAISSPKLFKEYKEIANSKTINQ